MARPIILASSSQIRADILTAANVVFDVVKPRVDEESLKAALDSEDASSRDIADALAEAKAQKVGMKHPEALVLGCDQVLSFEGKVMSKPQDISEARLQLEQLSGQKHTLLSAIVIFHDMRPIWRHVGQVRLHMRDISDAYKEDYLARNWDSIKTSVGGYKLEEEGVRLFSKIEGDYFSVLGLPLIELTNYLTLSGDLEG